MAGLLAVAALWLLPQVIQASPRGGPHFHRMLAPVRRQTPPNSDCKLWVSTDIWTTCQSLIDHYNITLVDFVKMNPDVHFDCYFFEPGQNYCLRMRELVASCALLIRALISKQRRTTRYRRTAAAARKQRQGLPASVRHLETVVGKQDS
jgi:hypothetical protein